jgi:hypothetical protein
VEKERGVTSRRTKEKPRCEEEGNWGSRTFRLTGDGSHVSWVRRQIPESHQTFFHASLGHPFFSPSTFSIYFDLLFINCVTLLHDT